MSITVDGAFVADVLTNKIEPLDAGSSGDFVTDKGVLAIRQSTNNPELTIVRVEQLSAIKLFYLRHLYPAPTKELPVDCIRRMLGYIVDASTPNTTTDDFDPAISSLTCAVFDCAALAFVSAHSDTNVSTEKRLQLDGPNAFSSGGLRLPDLWDNIPAFEAFNANMRPIFDRMPRFQTSLRSSLRNSSNDDGISIDEIVTMVSSATVTPVYSGLDHLKIIRRMVTRLAETGLSHDEIEMVVSGCNP